jgi:hypothetical protein
MATIAERAVQEGDSVVDYLKMCRTTLVGQLAAANEAGDARGAAFVVNALVRTLEATAKVTGELGALAGNITINNNTNLAVVNDAQFLQATMLRALAPFPDARSAVVLALRDLITRNAPSAPAAPAIGHVIEHVA